MAPGGPVDRCRCPTSTQMPAERNTQLYFGVAAMGSRERTGAMGAGRGAGSGVAGCRFRHQAVGLAPSADAGPGGETVAGQGQRRAVREPG